MEDGRFHNPKWNEYDQAGRLSSVGILEQQVNSAWHYVGNREYWIKEKTGTPAQLKQWKLEVDNYVFDIKVLLSDPNILIEYERILEDMYYNPEKSTAPIDRWREFQAKYGLNFEK